MKSLLLIGLATVCFAASEPIVSLGSLKAVEGAINDKLKSNINDPYDLLGTARGTYLEGYGAVFTVDVDLVLGGSFYATPFQPAISDKEKTALRERKEHKLAALKETMCGLVTRASESLPGLPSEEHVVLEAFLFNYSWENSRGLPHRIVFTAQKGKLLDALNRHAPAAEIAALIEQSEL
ncbi:MAG: hypothetical protein ABSB15_19665 [Bryobacteraceae bacterium]